MVNDEKNVRLVIEYDGGNYAGWQVQPGQRTVQGELENAIKKLTGQKVTLYGAGRTDAGVHALGQVANFKIRHHLPLKKYVDGLNFYLQQDIRIRRAEAMPSGFHSRYDAIYREYRYLIGQGASSLERGRRWEIDSPLDIQLLNDAADYILGEHDFAACCRVSSQKENNRCLIYASRWKRQGSILQYDITADRFLHTMIRSLVGLMVETARGGMKMKRYKEILTGGDHTVIKKIAPACGLYLVAIGY